jgi:predicted permease
MPDWNTDLRRRLASLKLSPAREAEIVEELSQHLEERYDELRAAGTPDVDARRLAIEELLETDTLARHMRSLRQAHATQPVPVAVPPGMTARDLWLDLRYAWRMLLRQPGFTAAAILTLALGIGANAAIFSLVNATLLRRLPVADGERLVHVHNRTIGSVFSYPMYERLRDDNHVFDGFAAWGGIAASLNTEDTTELITGVIVTGNFFDVLGVSAAQGRLLSKSDDETPGKHPVAVIGYDFWQARFAGRPDIVGREIRLNGQVFTIIGVAPRGFAGPQLGSVRNLYVPMMMQALIRPPRAGYSGEQSPDLLKNPNNGWLTGLGRLKQGTSLEQARAELETLATNYARSSDPARTARIPLVPFDEGDPNQRQQLQSVALLLGGVVGVVLLIACANIANLLLSRTASRRRELAVRLAIGASRARLVRQLLTESVLLSSMGGLAGLGLAWLAIEYLKAAPPPAGALPIAIDFAIDTRVLMFSLGLSFLTGIFFGVIPALKASRPGLVPALKNGTDDGGDRGRHVSLKNAVVVAEVALALPLLVAAGLFLRSLQSAQAIDPGFDAAKLVSAPLNINLLRYTRAQGREFYRNVVERMEQLPGVESASTARVAVLAGGGRVLSLLVEGRDGPDNRSMSEGGGFATSDPLSINANVIGPGFFKTLGIPLLTGRDFNTQDIEDRPLVVIVNETTVKMHFSGENPIGKRVSFGGRQGPWREIVGVVRDSKNASLGEPPRPFAFLPVAQNHETGMTLYVRAAVPPPTLVSAIRREIQNIDPNIPVPNIQTMNETIGTSLYAARMGAWLLGGFAILALTLAAIGVYGVLSFSISRRTREMGIRQALGAERRDLFLLVLRDGMLVVGIGILLGLIGGASGAKSLASFLYGVPALDVTTFAVTTAVLTVVALVACTIPARRAMRVSPVEAMRCD